MNLQERRRELSGGVAQFLSKLSEDTALHYIAHDDQNFIVDYFQSSRIKLKAYHKLSSDLIKLKDSFSSHCDFVY